MPRARSFNFSDLRATLPFPMPDTPLMIGTVPGFHKMPPRRDVNQAVNVAGGRGHAWGRISRARRAAWQKAVKALGRAF